MKKEFDILNHISEYEILEKLKYLGSKELTITGHGYKTFSNIPILESAQKSTLNYSNRSSVKPAIALIDVILAANRNYNKVVEPNINRIQEKYPDLKNFDELNKIINSQTKQEFYLFWGHKDEKKYNTLKNVLSKINELRVINPNLNDDFTLMNNWAINANILNYKNDLFGSISNIAIATFQHLRMVYGADTIKPDQRVKEVLDYEFGISNLSDINVIKAVEQLPKLPR